MWDTSTKYSSNISDLIEELTESIVPSLQEQIDSQVDYWFFNSTKCDKSNSCESINSITGYISWSDAEKLSHHGDIAYDIGTESGYYYDRYTNTWIEINGTTNRGVIQALKDASAAQTTADGKMSLYFAIEVKENTNPGKIDNIKYWFYNKTLKRISDNEPVIAYEGDELTTVVITPVVGTADTSKDYFKYTYDADSGWLLNTPRGLVARSGWAINLDSYLKDPTTGNFGGQSELSTSTKTASNGIVETAFAYSSGTKAIGGKQYNAGFGLKTTTGKGTLSDPYNSEFWIEASKFKLSSGNTAVPVFTVDTTTRQAVFNGKVMFGTNQTGTVNEALASVIVNGDKNINITDNLIPTTNFVTDTNHSEYRLEGTCNKAMGSGLDKFAEAQCHLVDSYSKMYSPYVMGLSVPYYYRFGFTGTNVIDQFRIVTISSLDNVTNGIITVNLNPGVTLSATDWYEIDGIINPHGGAAGTSGSIRNSFGAKIGTINNFIMSGTAVKLLLRWRGPCTVSRMKLARITSETLTGVVASTNFVKNITAELNTDLSFDIAAAQSAADLANTVIADIANDAKLTAGEKQAIKREWEIIAAEKTSLSDQADAFTVSKETYINKYNDLNTYLNEPVESALLTSLITTSDITSSTFTTKFKEYYTAKINLLNALAAKAKAVADSKVDNEGLASAMGFSTYEAMKKTTIISGGYIDTSLIDANALNITGTDGTSSVQINKDGIKVVVGGVTRVTIGKIS
jgi:hypothetical protein